MCCVDEVENMIAGGIVGGSSLIPVAAVMVRFLFS